MRLVILDDHVSIKEAVKVELPSAQWQRCVVHFEHNILAHVPLGDMAAVASDLKAIFRVHRRETTELLAKEFAERYGGVYPKATQTLA